MMSSVIPARLEFQCGRAALVSLPRIKGETSSQRAERVAREKSTAHLRVCDFCAPRLEVVVQAEATAPAVPAPAVPAVVADAVPVIIAETVPLVLPHRNGAPAAPTVPVLAATSSTAPAPAPEKPAESGAPEPKVTAARPVVRLRKVAPAAPAPAAAPAAPVRTVRAQRNGHVAGVRFTVRFEAEAVIQAADVRQALREAIALGASEVLAIAEES